MTGGFGVGLPRTLEVPKPLRFVASVVRAHATPLEVQEIQANYARALAPAPATVESDDGG